jgi:hypothetical protein
VRPGYGITPERKGSADACPPVSCLPLPLLSTPRGEPRSMRAPRQAGRATASPPRLGYLQRSPLVDGGDCGRGCWLTGPAVNCVDASLRWWTTSSRIAGTSNSPSIQTICARCAAPATVASLRRRHGSAQTPGGAVMIEKQGAIETPRVHGRHTASGMKQGETEGRLMPCCRLIAAAGESGYREPGSAPYGCPSAPRTHRR